MSENTHFRSARALARPVAFAIVLFTYFSLATVVAHSSAGADLTTARQLYREGKYAECAEMATTTISAGYHGEDWPLLKISSDMRRGRHAEALKTLDAALKTFRYSIRLRFAGLEVLQFNNLTDRGNLLSSEIADLATRSTYRYGDSANRVTLGKFYSNRGADPRSVLETFYDPVKKGQPQFADAFIASGELALSKNDFALAAEEFQMALKRLPNDPEIHFGLARAYASSDPERANQHAAKALEENPVHAPTLLLIADKKIDAEEYDSAEQDIQRVLSINSKHPLAWAYRAVLAHLRSDPKAEKNARDKALACWPTNPQVDHLIGCKLSHKYRFSEGSAYQRRSIAFDQSYMPAQIQLAQDLLRLGEVEEGWQRAELVFDVDAYNVVAHNLVRLRASMARFRTLENDDFIVRMDAKEAIIYGSRALQLLSDAKKSLCAKYDVVIAERVTVEIFPQQEEFAIRTFGLPGGSGFLGVCFGNVITANSPAAQGDHPSSLDSVLWHEFCHVVTLKKTRNRMPRWLSEGISVYEERQANSAWGQTMDLFHRKMIADGELTPVSELSGAFLRPDSALHLQFAYYESSLVVEYLIENYGPEIINRVLNDLGIGMPINESLGRYVGSIAALDKSFESYAQQRARAFGDQASWDKVDLDETSSLEELAAWVELHPNSFAGLQLYAQRLVTDEEYPAARKVIQQFIDLCPDYVGPDSGYALLAAVSRAEEDVKGEAEALEKLATRNGDAVDIFMRLMVLSKGTEDWESVSRNADRMLAVNPLIPAPHRFRAEAAEHLQDSQAAVQSYEALLAMEPADPALIHYRLAHHLSRQTLLERAQRHVLMALEEAPRYRDAHQLLLQILSQRTVGETSSNKLPGEPTLPSTNPSQTTEVSAAVTSGKTQRENPVASPDDKSGASENGKNDAGSSDEEKKGDGKDES